MESDEVTWHRVAAVDELQPFGFAEGFETDSAFGFPGSLFIVFAMQHQHRMAIALRGHVQQRIGPRVQAQFADRTRLEKPQSQ